MLVQTDNFGYESAFRCRMHNKPYNIPMHIHQYTEAVIVLDGEIDITIDAAVHSVKAGQAAVITPFTVHGFSTAKTCRLWICVFSNNLVSHLVSESELFEKVGNVFSPSKIVFDYLIEKLVMNDKRDELSIRAGLCVLMEEYLRTLGEGDARDITGVLSSVILYVSEHFREDISLASASRALGYSSGYISHTVCAIPGLSFHSLLSGIRVEHAKKLLLTGDLPVGVIALESGFSCERSFHRAFTKLTGMKPMEYRRQGRGLYS